MPADALTYSFIIDELNSTLAGAKIDKVSMPQKDEIILTVRGFRQQFLLGIFLGSAARVHLIKNSKPKQSPPAPFGFCMHLRKNIGGGTIKRVCQQPFERVFYIDILHKDELGVEQNMRLVLEIFGKYSNAALVDLSTNKITSVLRHIYPSEGFSRAVLPSACYFPPDSDKISPLDGDKILAADFGGDDLIKHIKGLAPISASEAAFNAGTDGVFVGVKQKKALADSLKNMYLSQKKPCVLTGGRSDFFIRPYNCVGGSGALDYQYFDTVNEAIENFYLKSDKSDFKIETGKYIQPIKNLLKKANKKILDFEKRLIDCQNADEYRVKGELITANIYKIKQGQTFVEAHNFYDEANQNSVLKIELDPMLSPSKNAQNYFKKYTKIKRSKVLLSGQIDKVDNEIAVLGSFLSDLEGVEDEQGLAVIVTALKNIGLVKQNKNEKTRQKGASEGAAKARPHQFVIDGVCIRVGKNNVENDLLVKQSKKDDIWLHVKGFSGSHVVIDCGGGGEVGDKVLQKAAGLAVYFSKAAGGGKQEVDYTKIKYVAKESGANPGKVVYVKYKTIVAKPIAPSEIDK
ncbi:MAG: NFACT family protein [Firmicutes bacterium]|nr:NFACT family protein [Bacillota bacterium]